MDNTMEKKNKQLERVKSYQLLVNFIAKRRKNKDNAG